MWLLEEARWDLPRISMHKLLVYFDHDQSKQNVPLTLLGEQ